MAALMESIAFTQIPNESDILEIADSNTHGNILLSLKKKSIVTYKVSDQKPQKSWSVRHGVTLTSPVRWDHSHGRYVTVTNSHDVKLWNSDLSDFSKAKTKHRIMENQINIMEKSWKYHGILLKKCTTKIHEVLTVPDYPDPILLYSNGCVGFLEDIKDEHNGGPLSDSDPVTWCTVCMMSTVLYVMFVVRIKDEIRLYVNWYNKDEEDWNTKYEVIPRSSSKQELCAIDSIYVDNTVNVYILWNDGSLSQAIVHEASVSVTTLPQIISGITKNSSMVLIDTSHVAVAGCKNGKEDGIAIFDIKFGLQKTWQALIEKPHSKCKIYCVQGHLFYPCGRTLYACKYECHTSTVSSILGRNITSVSTVPQHHVWAQGQKRKDENLPEDLSAQFTKLLEKNISYSTFKFCFGKLVRDLENKRNQHWLTSPQMVSLVHKIVGETKYWAKQEIQVLVEKQFIPSSAVDTVVDSLIQQSEINILHSLIKSNDNLSEKCMCRALSFYLQCDEEKIRSTITEIDKEDHSDVIATDMEDEGVDSDDDITESCKCPFSTEKAYLVDNVLVKPYSDVFLLECLRTLNFKDAEMLFEYLGYLLAKKSVLHDKDKNKKLNIPQVVDLLCLIIDAHMTQFVLSPYSHLTLIKMHNIVSNQVSFISSLVKLETLLLQLKKKSVLMHDKKVGQYCIEVLHIS